jgi:hypothetical protein
MNPYMVILATMWAFTLLIAVAHIVVGIVGGLPGWGLAFAIVDIAMAVSVSAFGVRLMRQDEEL